MDMAAVGGSRASKNARSKVSSSRAGKKKKKQRRISILRKPVFRSQPEVAANDSGGGIFKGDGTKSKGRSPDIEPWPSHPPGTFFSLAYWAANASVGASIVGGL